MNGPVTLSARQLQCGYGRNVILQDLDLQLEPGQLIALLGPNGSGKTTLLRALARLLRPRQGRVLLGDAHVWNMSPRAFARQVAVAPQQADRQWPLSVREAVLLGRTPHRGSWAPFTSEDQQICRAAIERLGLTPMIDRPITELSGGEWRRVVLARTLAQQPAALLLDEPTQQLDMKHQLAILRHVRELAHQDRLLVMISLHDLTHASLFADRIALLDGERRLRVGKPSALLTPDTLREVFGIEVEIIARDGRPAILPIID